ncbi:hypothetical protein BDV93DRAFT_48189 [Ceratobasidium sp. AG-I]|nr:hypothetical protein BDV93DRAFT_48189 [Ceratobasidium sp. AG-I]
MVRTDVDVDVLVVESAVLSEEPTEEPIAPVVVPVEPEVPSVLMAEPQSLEPAVEAPKPLETPKPFETPKREGSLKRKDSLSSMNAPKSLGRPRVMRRATGSTAAVAGVTTSPAPATTTTAPIAIADNKGSTRDRAMRRADDALSMLAGSILRSNTSDRMAPRPSSPANLPRSGSPANVPRSESPSGIPRSGSPAPGFRSESPSSETAGSRPASPALGMSRRGSIALANGARPNVSRQSSLANVTNAPAPSAPRQQSSLSNSAVTQSTFTGRRTPTFANAPRGGSVSPPPMPPPPQRQGSISRQPTVPQAAMTSPNILSRKATTDSNGSAGSPPTPARRPISPARPPAEEFTTSGSTARRRVPFPSASDGGQQPINAAPAPTPTPASRPRPRPRKSTSGGSSAPNTLQASLLANLGGPKPPSSEAAPTATANSSAASPIRRDSFASAVSNRDSILSFSDRSDMDMSDLDFSGGEGDRLGVKFPTGAGASDDEGMEGNEEEKRKRRARRRSKARTLSLKKQKRGKRN